MKTFKHLKTFESHSNSCTVADILDKIESAEHSSGWHGALQESFECASIENDWLKDVKNCEDIPDNLKQEIMDCMFDLWDVNLEYTFPCVVLEDVYGGDFETGEVSETPEVEYNGWYEKLKQLK
jgi:hypothetical protein